MKSIALANVAALLAVLAGCSSSESGTNATGSSGSAVPGSPGAAAPFFLPTGAVVDNTAAPTVVVDSKGATHALYPAFVKGGAYYWNGPDQTKAVKLETADTVGNAMLVLDAQDRPRVLLSSATKIYWATCDASCDQQASWTTTMILDHNGDREVSGHALALTSKGQPRFFMHTYRTYLGIGQKDPVTEWVSCDANCEQPASWTHTQMQDQLMESAYLKLDANDVAKVAGVQQGKAVYQECASGCGDVSGWHGIALGDAYASSADIVALPYEATMALTKSGAPRVAFMGADENGNRRIVYTACDGDCTNDHWHGTVLTNDAKLAVGLDLALTADDKPRLAYNFDWNIDIASCDDADCAGSAPKWNLTGVEVGSQIPADQIFLYTNCNVGGWFLHSPSIALTADGKARVGYQARDMSAGWSDQDYTQAGCSAGTDMTWSRLAIL